MQYTAGASTACLFPMETEKAFQVLLDCGCRIFEVFINAEFECKPSFIAELKRRADAYGARIVSVHPYHSAFEGMLLFDQYSRRKQEGFERYKRYMDTAAQLGAQYVVLHGVQRSSRVKWETDAFAEQYFIRFGELYAEGKRIGAVPAQENVHPWLSGSSQFIRRMREYLKEDCAFVCDIKQCRSENERIEDMVDAMGSRLKHIHMSDADMDCVCLLPGQGSFDFERMKEILRMQLYSGHLVTEVYRTSFAGIDMLEESLRFTDRIFNII